jgi:hypothetical protein
LNGYSCETCIERYYKKNKDCFPCLDKCLSCIESDPLNCTKCIGKNRIPNNFCYCKTKFIDKDIKLIEDCTECEKNYRKF